ncbi:hypothetical protein BHM03_00037700 [Ensete ventricosum]|nr:hypothetical protein BHM03_00037700 [Ensete ventricosum]
MRCLEIRPDSIARNRNGVEPAIMNGQDTFFDDGAFDRTIVVDLETLGGPFLWPFLTIRIPSNLGAHETALYFKCGSSRLVGPAIATGSKLQFELRELERIPFEEAAVSSLQPF